MDKINRKALVFAGLGAAFLFSSFIWGSTIAFKKTEQVKDEFVVKDGKVEKVAHIKTPDPVKGIYMTSWVASTRDWRSSMVKMIDETEVNSIVIDVKDYTGRISFEIPDPELTAIGSPEKRIDDIKEFISTLHQKNIYTIARISVFQDAYWVKKRPDLAVKTKAGAVWKDRKGISWLDPCSKEVWDYTVKIAKETEKVGFDELNFDYIRFPSDGDMKNIAYDFCPNGFSRADMLENFFKYLSEQLKDTGVPISADMFGFVSTNLDDLNIGQVLEKAAPHFDYICPMVYPSHYPPTYGGFKNPADHPYEVIKLAMDTAVKRLLNQGAGLAPLATSTPQFSTEETKRIGSKIRPWLQDFDMGATYTADMIRKEKQAVYDAGLNSWLLWDPANKYTREALD